jgi:hypothetical protein
MQEWLKAKTKYFIPMKSGNLWTPEPNAFKSTELHIRGPFEKFVDWQQCAAIMQR